MSKLKILIGLFRDIQYRAGQHGFDVQTRFDKERSAIQVYRREDKTVVYRFVDEIKDVDRRFKKSEELRSQVNCYERFISYMSFYGIFTVAHSYDEEQLEKKKKAKKEIKKKEKKKASKNA